MTFEEQMAALEEVVERLEHGELPLEESIRLFEEGMRLTAACRKELDAAEGRLQVLSSRPGGTMAAMELALEEDEATLRNERHEQLSDRASSRSPASREAPDERRNPADR